MEEKKLLDCVTGNCFIVPNKATRRDEVWNPERFDDLNGVNHTMDELFIQVWIVAKDYLHTDNLSDHGGMYGDQQIHADCTYIPASILLGKKEGEEVTVNFPATLGCRGEAQEAVLQMRLRLNQKDYRYRRFGTFEEVYKLVL